MSEADPLLESVAGADGDGDELLSSLAERLRDARRWPELLDVRLIEARRRHGLAADARSLADAPAALQAALEEEYSRACEEAGHGLAADGRWREAWYYLKTAGKSDALRDTLHTTEPTEDDADELIEVALHQGAAPAVGYRWLIEHHGACSAVTTLEGLGPHLPVADFAECAAVLVEHLLGELRQNLAAHIERREGKPPAEVQLPESLASHPWLFDEGFAHVDVSHLAAAVRAARAIESGDALQNAWRLADYGSRLDPSLPYPDAPPFEETFPAHRRFYAALLGEDVDDAVAHFRQRAEQADPETDGLAPLETLLVLLHRVGRPGEALREYGRLTPVGAELSPYAPRPIDLARASGDWAAYESAMRARGDVVGLALGRIVQREAGAV